MASTKKTVYVALGANAAIAVCKGAAGALTGSSVMLAEAAHSVADTVNQIFLRVSLSLGERAARALDEVLAGLGQLHSPGPPVHDRDAHLGHEPPDLLGQRGLGDLLTRGRSREVPLVGEGDQVAELPQFHNESL